MGDQNQTIREGSLNRVRTITATVVYLPLAIFFCIVSFGVFMHLKANNLHLLDSINGPNSSSTTPYVIPTGTPGNYEVRGDPGKIAGSERVVGNTVYYTHSAAKEAASNVGSGLLALVGNILYFLFWSFPFVVGAVVFGLVVKTVLDFCWTRNLKRIRFSFEYPDKLTSFQRRLLFALPLIGIVIGIFFGLNTQSLSLNIAHKIEVLIRDCYFFGWVFIWGWTIWKLRGNPPRVFERFAIFIAIFSLGLGLIGLFGFYAFHDSEFHSTGKNIWMVLTVVGFSILIAALKAEQPNSSEKN